MKIYPSSPSASSETFFPETVCPASMRIAPLFTMETSPSVAVAPSFTPISLPLFPSVTEVPENVAFSVAVTAPLCVMAPPVRTSSVFVESPANSNAPPFTSVTLPAVPETFPMALPSCPSAMSDVPALKTASEAVMAPPVWVAAPPMVSTPFASIEPPVCEREPTESPLPSTPSRVPATVAVPVTVFAVAAAVPAVWESSLMVSATSSPPLCVTLDLISPPVTSIFPPLCEKSLPVISEETETSPPATVTLSLNSTFFA